MKVYYVYPDDWDYDDYDAFIVVAENEDRALEMVKGRFKKWQGEIHAEEVDTNTEGIILGSYNAG